MALYFGNNQISTSGDYVKFGTTALTKVNFGTTKVWEKVTGYTLTLIGENGYWSPNSISNIPSGSSYSFSSSTKQLTVAGNTATFYLYNNGDLDNYVYSSISSSSGTITGATTITAYATLNSNITVYTDVVDVDYGMQPEGEIELDFTPTKVRVYFDLLGFNTLVKKKKIFFHCGNIQKNNKK